MGARLRCRSPHQYPVDDSWLYPWHHSRSLHHPQVLECARWLPSPDDLNTHLTKLASHNLRRPLFTARRSAVFISNEVLGTACSASDSEGLRWRYLITAGRSEGAKQHWLRNLDVLDMDLFCGHDCIRGGLNIFACLSCLVLKRQQFFFIFFSANI